MKQKLLTLFTLLLLVCSGAWGVDYETLFTVTGPTSKSITQNNVTVSSSNDIQSKTFNNVANTKVFKIDSKPLVITSTTNNITKITFTACYSSSGTSLAKSCKVSVSTDGETYNTLESGVTVSGGTGTSATNTAGIYISGYGGKTDVTVEFSTAYRYLKIEKDGKETWVNSLTVYKTAAPSTPTLTGAWKRNDVAVTEADVIVQGGSVTMPTFTVGATSGDPSGKYNVSYAFKSGYQSGIFEESEGNPTITSNQPSIASTAVTGTATIVATLTTTDAKSFAQPTTNTFEYTVTINAPAAPTFSPDASAVVSGTAITMTSPDGGEIWYTTSGVDPTESNKTVYDEEAKPTITDATTIKAIARVNGYSSAVTTAEYTLVTLLEEATSVNTAKTWDWTKVSGDNVSSLSSSTTPTNTEEFVYDNLRILYNLTFTDPFDATALLVKGKNVWDGGAFRAGGSSYIKINFIVPGLVKVTYSNTGNSNGTRYASVNGTRVGSGSSKNGGGETTGSIHVTTGVTTIAGLQDATGNEGGDVRIRKIEFIPDVPVTISSAKYATFASDYDLDFSNMDDEGLYAYTATEKASEIEFKQVDGSVKAGEGLLLYSATAKTYNVPVATNSPAAVSGNKLVRGTGAAVASTDDEGATYNYVLSNNGGEVNFYRAAGKEVGKNKAYLKNIPEGVAGAKFFLPTGDEEGEETDEIRSIENSELRMENSDYYNLAGQKVGADYKGIVIVNGKKIVRK